MEKSRSSSKKKDEIARERDTALALVERLQSIINAAQATLDEWQAPAEMYGQPLTLSGRIHYLAVELARLAEIE